MSETFSKKYTVAPVHTDMFGLLRPSSLLAFMQDTANGHAGLLGMGRETLVERSGAVWVMTRLRYRLLRPIAGYEPLTITTWHRMPKASFIYRDFDISADGEHVGEAVTMWAVMDFNTHKLMRLDSAGVIACSKPYNACYTEELSRLRRPEVLQLHETRLMRYSDADINAHVNNTRYADFACDAVSERLLGDAYISGMQINFNAECFPGEQIQIFTAELRDTAYIAGVGGDKPRFEAILYTAPR